MTHTGKGFDLHKIPCELFASNPLLATLKLDSNRLVVLNHETVKMMGTLRTLTLDKNQLSTLPYNFADLYELESLSIAGNKLRNVSRCMCAATNVQNAPVLSLSLSLVHTRYYSLPLSLYSSLSLPLSLSLFSDSTHDSQDELAANARRSGERYFVAARFNSTMC
mgnify:CR=1 FL=1